jgi:hypothetical protein
MKIVRYWVCSGPVRGNCGRRHRSESSARACCKRDAAAIRCSAYCGSGSYSDRAPVEIETFILPKVLR